MGEANMGFSFDSVVCAYSVTLCVTIIYNITQRSFESPSFINCQYLYSKTRKNPASDQRKRRTP